MVKVQTRGEIMTGSPTRGRFADTVVRSPNGVSTAALAAAFALFVFVVTTFRAAFDPEVPLDVLSDKRIVATLLGAVVYWLTLRTISRRINAPISDIIRATLRIVIIGSVALLAVRAAMDLANAVSLDVSIARNVRWLLFWLGYFASWVAGFVAHAFYLRLKASSAVSASFTEPAGSVSPGASDVYACADTVYAPSNHG